MAREPSAQTARRMLASGDLKGCVDYARRTFAESALRQGISIPGNPEFVMRKLFLHRFAAETAPGWGEAQERCGELFLQLADNETAAFYLGRAFTLNPADGFTGMRLGGALLSLDRFEEASRVLTRVAQANPLEPGPWFYLGQAEMGRERPDAAVRAFKRYLLLSPDSPQAPAVKKVIASLSRKK